MTDHPNPPATDAHSAAAHARHIATASRAEANDRPPGTGQDRTDNRLAQLADIVADLVDAHTHLVNALQPPPEPPHPALTHALDQAAKPRRTVGP